MCAWTIDQWLELSNNLLTGAGVIATSVFSFMLWKVTKRSTEAAEKSAEAAKAATELALNSAKDNEIKTKAMRLQCLRILKEQAWDIISELSDLEIHKGRSSTYFNKKMAPDITPIDIASFFNDEDAKIINTAWDNLITHLFNYWNRENSHKSSRDVKYSTPHSAKYLSELESIMDDFVAITEIN